jgi:hypothetical protein
MGAAGFEPAPVELQSSVLPGYTTRPQTYAGQE